VSIQVLKGRYQIKRQLSKKSRRLTLLAQDQQTNQPVVVKILGLLDRDEQASLPRFEQEMKLLQSLQHPALPMHLDWFQQDLRGAIGFAYVQQYVPARSIKEYLKGGRVFSETEAKQIARQVLVVLKYLHSLPDPVLHRNIKPSNLLLAEDETGIKQVYLIDFGAVQMAATPDDSSSTITSSYDYLAPEQFAGKPVVSSDLFSLGTTVISMVTGKLIAELPRRGARVQFEEAVSLSPEFTDWLRRMTDVNLLTRFPSAELASIVVSMM